MRIFVKGNKFVTSKVLILYYDVHIIVINGIFIISCMILCGEDVTLSLALLLPLCCQTHATVRIPKEHHRFVLGQKGKKLNELELATATKISVPRPSDQSDCIMVSGTREGIDRARHEIQLISDEQV